MMNLKRNLKKENIIEFFIKLIILQLIFFSVKIKTDILVNTYTPNLQNRGEIVQSSVTEFIFIWESYKQIWSYDIFGQRYDFNGNKIGTEISRINTITDSANDCKKIAKLTSGKFAMVWLTKNNGNYCDIHMNIFTPYFEKVFPIEVYVNPVTLTAENQLRPCVCALLSDSFVIAYNDKGTSIEAVIMDSSRKFIKSAFKVNKSSENIHYDSSCNGFSVS